MSVAQRRSNCRREVGITEFVRRKRGRCKRGSDRCCELGITGTRIRVQLARRGRPSIVTASEVHHLHASYERSSLIKRIIYQSIFFKKYLLVDENLECLAHDSWTSGNKWQYLILWTGLGWKKHRLTGSGSQGIANIANVALCLIVWKARALIIIARMRRVLASVQENEVLGSTAEIKILNTRRRKDMEARKQIPSSQAPRCAEIILHKI